MNIGQRIREVREDLGMQAAVLARRVEVAPNTIYRIETGDRMPSVGLLEKIARELRTEPAELMREPALAGKAEALRESGRPGEETLSLAELNRRTLEYIDAIADQNRRARARAEASEVIPQPYFVHGESAIVELLSGEPSDVAAQVVAEVGARLRLEVAERDLKIARLEAELETTERDNALLRQEIANLAAEREGAER